MSGINLTRQSGKILTHRQILLTSWPVGGNGIVTLTGSNPSRGNRQLSPSSASDVKQAPCISMFVVTPYEQDAERLSQLLWGATPNIRVEWVRSGRMRLRRLMKRLSRASEPMPYIVMMDFQSLGGKIWQFISRCARLLPDLTIEWFVINHRGAYPKLNDRLWQNLTILGERSTLH